MRRYSIREGEHLGPRWEDVMVPDPDGDWVDSDDADARIAALESQLADRHAERVSEIDAHMERVAGLEAQLAQYRWRRVEDEMPDDGLRVLVHREYVRWEAIAFRISGIWFADGRRLSTPTHWMPLPPAPEEGE